MSISCITTNCLTRLTDHSVSFFATSRIVVGKPMASDGLCERF